MIKKMWCLLLIAAFIICTAAPLLQNDESSGAHHSANESFADNRILVTLTNEASLLFKEYKPTDFSEIQCCTVIDLSDATGKLVKTKMDAISANGEPCAILTDVCVDS